MKKCPYCAEEIKNEVIVCRYCGRDVTLPVPPKPKAQLETKEQPDKQKNAAVK